MRSERGTVSWRRRLLQTLACDVAAATGVGSGVSLVHRHPRSSCGGSGDPRPSSVKLHQETPDHRVVVATPRHPSCVASIAGWLETSFVANCRGRSATAYFTAFRSMSAKRPWAHGVWREPRTAAPAGGSSAREVAWPMAIGKLERVEPRQARRCRRAGPRTDGISRPPPGLGSLVLLRHEVRSSTSSRTKSFGPVDRAEGRCPGRVQPLVPDEHQHDLTPVDLVADVFLEVCSGWDRVEVHENLGLGQPVPKAVVQRVRLGLAVARRYEMKMRCSVLMCPSPARRQVAVETIRPSSP